MCHVLCAIELPCAAELLCSLSLPVPTEPPDSQPRTAALRPPCRAELLPNGRTSGSDRRTGTHPGRARIGVGATERAVPADNAALRTAHGPEVPAGRRRRSSARRCSRCWVRSERRPLAHRRVRRGPHPSPSAAVAPRGGGDSTRAAPRPARNRSRSRAEPNAVPANASRGPSESGRARSDPQSGQCCAAKRHRGHCGHCGHCCCYGSTAQRALRALQMALWALLLLWHCWHCGHHCNYGTVALLALRGGTAGTAAAVMALLALWHCWHCRVALQALLALLALLQLWHCGTAGTAGWHCGHCCCCYGTAGTARWHSGQCCCYGTAGTAKWHCGHCCCYGTVAQQALQMALRALLLLWHCGVAQRAQQSWHCSPTELALWHGTLALLEGLRGVRG